MRFGPTLLLLALGLQFGCCGRAPLPGKAEPALAAMLATAEAAQAGASLARGRAASPEIRNLADQVERDTTRFMARVRGLAQANGVEIIRVERPAQGQLAELTADRSGDFDRKYLVYNYGALTQLERQLEAGQAGVWPELARFGPVLRQSQFLSGWCLGHCLVGRSR